MVRTAMLAAGAALAVALAAGAAKAADSHWTEAERARWRAEAADVTVTRDDWGIAHVHGRSDADAVFGAIYAEAEDDFGRIEANYLTALGRVAEAEGETALMEDLRARLYVDPNDLKGRYRSAPTWLKALMDAWSDGLNCFLATHPDVRPKALGRFEPWMALSFSEGSIGGDIERVPLADLGAFYGGPPIAAVSEKWASRRNLDGTGSNGIAIAPKNTRDGHALLLINPHTSFYFRSELQMTSDAGLDAYGAATWGQFFIYQGFNPKLGWMHTTSQSDAVDQFLETVVKRGGRLYTRYGPALSPIATSSVSLRYRNPAGGFSERTFTIYKSRHGPIVGKAPDGRWIAEAMMFAPVPALEQSFNLTKARSLPEFMKVMELKANTSNNTVYADADGHIALLLPQFIPRRDDRFDYSKPVDGADPADDWRGLHALREAPNVVDPTVGWIQNTNNWPYSAAGPDSPKAADFPRYMDFGGENVRGLHAMALLTGRHDFTLEGLRRAAFDPHLPGFDILIPRLLAAYDSAPADDPMKARLAGQIALLRGWDRRWAIDSPATSLAVAWGEALWDALGKPLETSQISDYDEVIARGSPAILLTALAEASARLQGNFGDWRTPWGEINRFQRLNDNIVQVPSDAAPSIPVGFTSSQWGSLAAIKGQRYPGVKRRYGDDGNSFVAVVEFGPRVRALAVTAGGESGDPRSPHFDDEAQRYASGDLRPVYFYPDDLRGHVVRRYHPGRATF